MSTSLFRAWRFDHPDFDPVEGASGLLISATGAIGMVEQDASVRQAILLLLSTRPGERVMCPSYGCDLQRLLFSPNDETTAGLALHYVRGALRRWEPRIELLQLRAERNRFDAGTLDIVLEYRVLATRRQEKLVYSLNLHDSEE